VQQYDEAKFMKLTPCFLAVAELLVSIWFKVGAAFTIDWCPNSSWEQHIAA